MEDTFPMACNFDVGSCSKLRESHEVDFVDQLVSADSSSSVSTGYIIEFMLEDLEAVPADYVPAGHVLISADRYRIC
ncbi:hypothetical protein Tco_0069449 [Tanacetum coccineum]